MRASVLLATVAAMLATAPAAALTIKLNNVGGVDPGSQALHGFRIAAAYWESQLTNDVTVNLDVGFSSLDPDVLGQTGSSYWVDSAKNFEGAIKSNAKTTTAIQAAAHLPTLSEAGAIKMITPGYVDPATKEGIDARTRLYDVDGSANNTTLGTTTANAKALGLYSGSATSSDASITFNSDFDFDFDPRNGLTGINFVQVAIHEIGHALGFVSGVDDYDYIGCPNGPGCADYSTFNTNTTWWGSTLDLYRYSANPTAIPTSEGGVLAAGPALDWSIRNGATDGAAFAQPYFSIDSGTSALFGNLESRGQFNTNSYQASHWRSATIAGQPYLGIMDPVGNNDKDYAVTALDMAAFNAIGWNTRVDALLDPNYAILTGDIVALSTVPEPAEWALLIAGFGLVGAVARRRAAPVRESAA